MLHTQATGRKIYKFLETVSEKNLMIVDDGVVQLFDIERHRLLLLDTVYELEHLGHIKGADALVSSVMYEYNAWVEEETANDPRRIGPKYPYTYACDYLVVTGPSTDTGHPKLSREDASIVRGAVAKVLGLADHVLAARLADHYLENEAELMEAAVMRIRARTA